MRLALPSSCRLREHRYEAGQLSPPDPWHPLGVGSFLPAQPRATLAAGGGFTCPLGRALAVVGVDAIHAGASILAVVARTVIDVLLTVLAHEPCAEETSSMMLADQPAVPLPQPPTAPPPIAGCLLWGAERAPGAPSLALKPAARFHPQPRPASAGLRFCCAGFPARAPSPESGKRQRLPPHRADGPSPAQSSPAKAPGSGETRSKRRRIRLHSKPG